LLRSIEKIAMVSLSFFRCLLVLVLSGMGLVACAGAPVQEMSNARQAIKAARDATGHSTAAPASLTEAEALLIRAEGNLQRRAYKAARRDAIAARGKAAEALSSTRTADDRNGAG
jgi:hypothetical protein